MARQKIPGVKKSRLQQLSAARASKRRKLDTEATPEPEPIPNHESEEEGWYFNDSSDSEGSDSSEEEGEEEEGEEDDWDESPVLPSPIIATPPLSQPLAPPLPSLPALSPFSLPAPSLPLLPAPPLPPLPAPPPSPKPLRLIQDVLKFNKVGEDKLRGTWGRGSKAMEERKAKSARESQQQASQTYSISALLARSQEKAARREQERLDNMSGDIELSREEERNTQDIPIPAACGPPLTFKQQQIEKQVQALADLEKLLSSVTEQDRKYGCRFSPHTNFFQRHLMVKQFLNIQKRRLPGQTQRDLAISVAASFGRGHTTGRNIVRWEKAWVTTREIPARRGAEMYESWLTDENVVMAIREFAQKQGDKLSSYPLPSPR